MTSILQKIIKLQKEDPFSIAEKLTKQFSNTGDEGSEALAFRIQMLKNAKMEELLNEAKDTIYGSSVADYLRITQAFGFEIVYTEQFMIGVAEETFYVLFHQKYGIILTFESYTKENQTKGINSAEMYYNWSPNGDKQFLTSSGCYLGRSDKTGLVLFEPDLMTQYLIPNYPQIPEWDSTRQNFKEYNEETHILRETQTLLFEKARLEGKRILWIGSHDAMQGVISALNALLENGIFFPIWHDCPFAWLTTYSEHIDNTKFDYTIHYKNTKARLAKLPKEVLTCINGKYTK